MSDQQIPTVLALRSRRRILEDAAQGLGMSRGAHISIRGGRFRLIDAKGVETLVPTHHVDVVIIDANNNPARIYYPDTYQDDSEEPPTCWSDNGVGPSVQAITPQSATCQQCPQNVRGSAISFRGAAITACSTRKKVACIIPGDTVINVYELQITPGSLTNFRDYCKFIGSQSTGERAADIADFVTRVDFDPDKQFVMRFNAVEWADDDDTIKLIEHIDANKLSDSVVGRNDVAISAEAFEQRLAAPTARPAVADSRPAAQTHTLPPRTNGAAPQALSAPVAEIAPAAQPAASSPPASRKRTPSKAEPQVATAENGAAAPRAPDIDTSIPAFLRCTAEPTQGAAQMPVAPPPRFGVGNAPPPPAELADALSKAMALPTRRG